MPDRQGLQQSLNLNNEIDKALNATEELCETKSSQNYFRLHRQRYESMAFEIANKYGKFTGLRVLDVGSLFLHFPVMLTLLGAIPSGVDVSKFSQREETIRLALKLGIENLTMDDLEHGLSKAIDQKSYDLIVFSEIIEHITFNPTIMWKTMLSAIPDGWILITTPNAFTLHKLPGYISRLLGLDGYGIRVEQILSEPTYAHHWKEYSVNEMKRYFHLLGDEFYAEVFSVRGYDNFDGSKFRLLIRKTLIGISNCIPSLRFQIFCWVRENRTLSPDLMSEN